MDMCRNNKLFRHTQQSSDFSGNHELHNLTVYYLDSQENHYNSRFLED